MNEQQTPYVLNPNYQQWVLDQDEADDLVSIPADHTHRWHLDVNVKIVDDDILDNVITAWCQCGEELSQSEIEATLNKVVQA